MLLLLFVRGWFLFLFLQAHILFLQAHVGFLAVSSLCSFLTLIFRSKSRGAQEVEGTGKGGGQVGHRTLHFPTSKAEREKKKKKINEKWKAKIKAE